MHSIILERCFLVFSVLGVRPEKTKSKIPKVIFFSIISMSFTKTYLIILLYVYKGDTLTVEDFIHAFGELSMVIHGTIKLANLFVNKGKIYELLNCTKYFWSTHKDHEEAKDETHNSLYVKAIFQSDVAMCVFSAIFFIVQMILKGADASFPSYQPEWQPEFLKHLFEIMMCSLCIILPIIFSDIFFMTLLMLIQKQFIVLNRKFLYLFVDEKLVRDRKRFNQEIGQCIWYHNLLIKCINDFNDCFSTMMIYYIGIVTTLLCTHMYAIGAMNLNGVVTEDIIRCILGFFELVICYSFPAQLLENEASKLSESIYLSDWCDYPAEAKSVRFIMEAGQLKLFVKIGAFGKLNMDTCMRTVQTMVSYLMFLRNVSY